MPLPQAATTFSLREKLTPRGEIVEIALTEILDEAIAAAVRLTRNSPASTISFRRPISSGPKVTGRCAPIFTPVQPLSLCEAVTMATAGTSRANCAK